MPSFLNIERAFRREAENLGKQFEDSIGKAIPEGMREAGKQAAAEGEKAGQAYAGAFASTVRKHLDKASKGFQPIELKADSSDVERTIAQIQADLETLRTATIGVELTEKEFFEEAARVQREAERLDREDVSIEIRTNARAVIAEMQAVERIARRARGTDMGQFAQALGDRAANEQFLRALRERQQAAERAAFEQAIADRATHERYLRGLREQEQQRARAAAQAAERIGGALAEQIRRRLDGALQAVGEIEVDADTSQADAELAALAARLRALREQRIDVDIPASQYGPELEELEFRLNRLADETVDVRIRTNARQARAEVSALLDFMDGESERRGRDSGEGFGGAFGSAARRAITGALAALPDVEIDADTSDTRLEIAALRAELLDLRDVRVGVDIDAGLFYAQIQRIQQRLRQMDAEDIDVEMHTNLLSAAGELAAVQVMIDRLNGQKIKIDPEVNTLSLRELANEAGVSMSRLGLLLSVGAAIGPAIVPAAAAAAASISAIAVAASSAVIGIGVFALALSGIVKAVQALNKYETDQAKVSKSLGQSQTQVANALDGVRSAERSLAATREQVARGARDSARQVVAAQRSVIDAQKDAERAQRDLIRAMQEARQADEDRAYALRENSLAQRQANLDIKDAKAELDQILTNPRATAEEREQARITYEQRLLQLEQLGTAGRRLEQERKRVAQEGADGVVAAQERVLAANRAVAEAQERHALALEAQREQEIDGRRQVIEANENLVRSQRALAQAYRGVEVAGGEALSNLREAMGQLSPAGQRFALFIFSLKDELLGLRAVAEAGLLPGLEQGLKNLLPFLPAVEKLVGDVATALGEIFVDFTEQLKDPIWREFFGFLAASAVPALKGMFQFAMNIAKGLAGIILGLSGFNGDVGDGLLKMSEGFAKWGTSLDTNQGWKKFLDYVRQAGPKVVELFKQIWDFTKKFVEAAAPIGLFVVDAFTKIFEWLNKLDTKTWTIIIGALGGIALGLLAVSAATALISTGWAGLIVAAIGLIAAEWAYLYTQVEPVRKIIDGTFHAIATVISWAWENVIKPALSGIAWYLENYVAPAFEWVWGHVIKPIFGFWQAGFNVLAAVAKVAFGLIQIALKVAGGVFLAWWDNVIKPLWKNFIQPFFEWLGNVFNKYVLPYWKIQIAALGKIWDGIVTAFKSPVKLVVDIVLNKGLLAAYNKIAKFFHVKPDDVQIELPKNFARGGRIFGPGTGTSDDVPIWASAGEHMWTAAEVRAVGGHEVMYGLRQAALNGTLIGGLRAGGGIGEGPGDLFGWAKKKATDVIGGITDFFTDPAGTLRKLADQLLKTVPVPDDGMFKTVFAVPRRALDFLIDKVKGLFLGDRDEGNSRGGKGNVLGGSQGMIGILRGVFPGLPLNSGFRPGAVTLTGNRSYHADNRAIDVPPRMEVFNWIRDRYPNSRELIFSPAGGRQIHNGRSHMYGEPVRGQHWDHVHWAYDQGGLLPPGMSMAWNGTGAPEAVLTGGQWRDIRSLAASGAVSGNTYHFEFADTTLTPGYLRALQDRDAVLARVGRPS